MKRSGFKKVVGATVVATGLLASGSAMAATDVFLKIDGIQGESADAKHPGEIDVLSWSWGQSTETVRNGRGNQQAACFTDLNLMKSIDSSSPSLIMNGMLGTVAPTAVMVLRKAGKEQFEYLRLTMKNVTVASLQISGASETPTESVALHFESMQGFYQKQKPDGTPSGPPITWDISGGNSRACR